jgi:hypothetical protein
MAATRDHWLSSRIWPPLATPRCHRRALTSESEFGCLTLRLAVYYQSVPLGAKLLRTQNQHFFQLNTCGYSPYVTSFITRGWVCRLQLLLALVSAVSLGSDSRGTHDHNLLSEIRDSPNLEGQVPASKTSSIVARVCVCLL